LDLDAVCGGGSAVSKDEAAGRVGDDPTLGQFLGRYGHPTVTNEEFVAYM